MAQVTAVDGRPSFWTRCSRSVVKFQLKKMNLAEAIATGKAEEKVLKTIMSPTQKQIARTKNGEKINSVIDEEVHMMTNNPVRDFVGKAVLGPGFFFEKKVLESYLENK